MLGISMVIDNPHNVGKIADILVKIQFWRKNGRKIMCWSDVRVA